jgi:SAM-dependent methyltransferase
MSDRETIAVYDAQAQKYATLVSRDTPDQDLQRFIDGVTPGGAVLDLGCGPGNSAAMMRDAGFKVTAWDASEQMVCFARETFGLAAEVQTFDDINFSERFDGIWANFSLLHAASSDLPRHLSAIHRALIPGGLFHIGMKTGEQGMERDRIGRFYSYYTVPQLRSLVRGAGFTIETEREGRDTGLSGDISPFVILTARKDAA